MKSAEELKNNSLELKRKIATLIDAFVLENGQCEIQIDIDYHYVKHQNGINSLIGAELNVTLKV